MRYQEIREETGKKEEGKKGGKQERWKDGENGRNKKLGRNMNEGIKTGKKGGK